MSDIQETRKKPRRLKRLSEARGKAHNIKHHKTNARKQEANTESIQGSTQPQVLVSDKEPPKHRNRPQRHLWATDNGLNRKQERFVREYLVDLNGTQAAKRSGYSERSACEQASRLLRKDHVRRAVDQALATDAAGLRVSIGEGLAKIAFHDADETSPNKLSALDKLAKVTKMYQDNGGNQVQVNIKVGDDIKALC
ncbi:MAG: terminase small subunit [Planctomycetaceae bacterium]|nr:terminase small subunit [Planctomycetaceae bacterium]